MRQVVVVSGHICTGKSGLAWRLRERFGFAVLNVSDVVRAAAAAQGREPTRRNLQHIGEYLDALSDYEWVHRSAKDFAENLPSEQPVVVESVRNWRQIEPFRSSRSIQLTHVHLYGSPGQLKARFERKHGLDGDYTEDDLIQCESDISRFKLDADVRINTDYTDDEDTFVRVAARLNLYTSSDASCVDVLVGGQYGSEGKGHVAAYLAKEYDVLLRVGGPNAGHTVSGRDSVFTYHQLPSGARETSGRILLGPGMTIDVEGLMHEIAECGITPERLYVDPQAMVISKELKSRSDGSFRALVLQVAAAAQRPPAVFQVEVKKPPCSLGIAKSFGHTLGRVQGIEGAL